MASLSLIQKPLVSPANILYGTHMLCCNNQKHYPFHVHSQNHRSFAVAFCPFIRSFFWAVCVYVFFFWVNAVLKEHGKKETRRYNNKKSNHVNKIESIIKSRQPMQQIGQFEEWQPSGLPKGAEPVFQFKNERWNMCNGFWLRFTFMMNMVLFELSPYL